MGLAMLNSNNGEGVQEIYLLFINCYLDGLGSLSRDD